VCIAFLSHPFKDRTPVSGTCEQTDRTISPPVFPSCYRLFCHLNQWVTNLYRDVGYLPEESMKKHICDMTRGLKFYLVTKWSDMVARLHDKYAWARLAFLPGYDNVSSCGLTPDCSGELRKKAHWCEVEAVWNGK
jgi:hypothetical protein